MQQSKKLTRGWNLDNLAGLVSALQPLSNAKKGFSIATAIKANPTLLGCTPQEVRSNLLGYLAEPHLDMDWSSLLSKFPPLVTLHWKDTISKLESLKHHLASIFGHDQSNSLLAAITTSVAVFLSLTNLTRGSESLGALVGPTDAYKAIYKHPAVLAIPSKKLVPRVANLNRYFGKDGARRVVGRQPLVLTVSSGNLELRIESRLGILPRKRLVGLKVLES